MSFASSQYNTAGFDDPLLINIPEDVALKLKAARKQHQNKCQKRQSLSKHKYAYILGKNRKETRELKKMLKVKTYPYPKERGL